MECSDARELIQERLAGELDSESAQALEEHLAGCPNCRDLAAGISKLDTLLSGEPMLEVPEGFGARVLAAASRRRRSVVVVERRNLRIAAACVAAALLFAAILPLLVVLPERAEITEKLAALTPQLGEAAQLTGRLAEMAPALPESTPTLASTVEGVQSSWNSITDIELPRPGLTGTIMLLLGIFGAVALAFEAAYLTLWARRKR